MAASDIYQLTNDDAVEEFKRILASKPAWKKLEDSQFIEHLAIFNSWQYRAAMWRLERDRQEAFLSTAINRSSVLAGAEDKSYVPRMAIASKGKALFSSSHNDDISLNSGMVFLMPDQTPVTLDDNVIVPANGTVTGDISQVESYVERHTVIDSKAFYSVLINKELTKSVSGISVFVDGNRWSYKPRLMNASPSTPAYDLFYTSLDQIGVRFGDGFFGKIPSNNSIIEIELNLTKGNIEIASGQKMNRLVVSGDNPILSKIKAETSTIINGGSPQEDIESIRLNAKYYPLYDEQLVWHDDYEFQISRMWPKAVWIRVWGEQEQEQVYGFDVQHINKIYISAWDPENTTIGTEILAKLEEPINRRYIFVAPEMKPFTINLIAVIPRTIQKEEATQRIKKVLNDSYGRDSDRSTRKTAVRIKDFYSMIEATGVFSDGGEFEVDINGLQADNGLNDFIYLDLDLSTLVVNYG